MKNRIRTITLAAAVATSFCLAENKVVDAHAKSIRGGSPALLEKVSQPERKTVPGLDTSRLDLRSSSSFGSRIRGVGEVQQTAAHAIADSIDPGDLGADYVIPSVFDSSVARNVARAVKKAAIASGVSRR